MALAISTAPIILTPRLLPTRLTLPARLLALLISIGCLTILVIAAYLTPSPEGTGTHTGLGFHHCQFLAATNVPCPTCGMTTATSWFVRGHLVASLYTQPMGFVFALMVAITFWAALYIAISGRPTYRVLTRLPTSRMLFGILLFACGAWGWKIFIHLKGIDGWG